MANVKLCTLRGTFWEFNTSHTAFVNLQNLESGTVVATRHDGCKVQVDSEKNLVCRGYVLTKVGRCGDILELLGVADELSPPAERRYQCHGCQRPFSRALGDAVLLVISHRGVDPVCCEGCQKTVTGRI